MKTQVMSVVKCAVLVCMVLSMGSGCRRFGFGGRGKVPAGTGTGGSSFTPIELDGDFVLSDRFEDGERITDVSFDPVYFTYDSFGIGAAETAKIQRVADYMRRNARVRLVVEGHCDERGSREYNLSLGERRALSIRTVLISQGIDPSRIQTRSYGKEMPVAFGRTEADWAQNRRGEFALYR